MENGVQGIIRSARFGRPSLDFDFTGPGFKWSHGSICTSHELSRDIAATRISLGSRACKNCNNSYRRVSIGAD